MRVLVCDVGPRDGLPNEADVLAPAVRAELGVATPGRVGALVDVAEWLEGILGRRPPGQVHRAGSFPAVA
jgi:hypothetical protein